MTLVRYHGHAGTLPDYLDLDAGTTLTAEPGRVYDVAPASGRLVPDVPGNCVALEGEELDAELAARGVPHEAWQEPQDDSGAPDSGEQVAEDGPASEPEG